MKRITAFFITLFILLSVLSACGQTAGVTSDFSATGDSSSEIISDSTFGAPDPYYANNVISQSYVDYCESITSGDIMFSTYIGEHISNEFTELDAYYVGLTDSSETVEAWDLGLSEHELYGGECVEG